MSPIDFAKLKKGDRVKVIRHPSTYFGKTGTVFDGVIADLVVVILDGDRQKYLFYHNEIEHAPAVAVPTTKPKTDNRYPHRCPRPSCGAPAYVGFCDVDCSRCGKR
jgi:hypothetical protein